MQTHVDLNSLPPVLLAWFETPYTADDGPPPLPPELFLTPYSRRLATHGLTDKATRADNETSYFKWFRDADRQTWRQHAANAMLRTMPYYAKQQAESQYNKYLPMAEFIPSNQFCRVTFTFSTWDVTESQRLLSIVRGLTSSLLPHSLDKVGSLGEHPAVKILHTSPMTPDLARKIQSAIPSGVKFNYSNHPLESFRAELANVTCADLPTSDTHRADLEAILGSSHQIKLHKFSKEERDKFVYEPSAYTNLSEGMEEDSGPEGESSTGRKGKPVPKNPITGKPAVWCSGIVSESVKGGEIPEHEWKLLTSE